MNDEEGGSMKGGDHVAETTTQQDEPFRIMQTRAVHAMVVVVRIRVLYLTPSFSYEGQQLPET